MNFYVDSGGVVLHVEPERLFQGSANANTLRFIGAFAPNLPVLVAFKLPNGVWTTPQSMGFSAQLSGVETKDGVQFNTWEYQIPQVVTENYGTVNVQFYVYGDAGGTGGQIASAMSSFVVEKGVPITLPDPTDDYQTLLTQILAVLSQIQNEIIDLPNNYVPKVSGSNVAYINDQNGATATKPFAVDVTDNALVARDGNGQIRVPLAPLQGYDAVSKKYVDDADNTKLNKVEPFASGTYAYVVSKSDIFWTANGCTEISETDKISTIAKRKTNGCIETRTPYADVEAANKGYVDTAISDTQSQLAQTNQNVEDLYTILEQAQVVTVTTLEQAYTTRETADGENIVDGVQTTVKEIRGKTVATTNLTTYPYAESTLTRNGVTFTDNGDGSITVNGTAAAQTDFILSASNNPASASLNAGQSYTLSGCPSGGGEDKYILRCSGSPSGVWNDTGSSRTFSPTDNTTPYNFCIRIAAGYTANNLVFRPMLNEGTEAKPYSKWFAGLKNASFEKIVSTSRNLLSPSDVLNGIFMDENGATSGNTNIYRSIICYLPAGTYTLSSNISLHFIKQMVDGTISSITTDGTSYTITSIQTGFIGLAFRRTDDMNYDDGTELMLNYGSSALPYEPYISDTLSAATPIELAEYDVADTETGETKRQSNTLTFNGTENWTANTNYTAFSLDLPSKGIAFTSICSPYRSPKITAWNQLKDYEAQNGELVLLIKDSTYSTVDEWKAHLAELAAAGNPVTVTYKTAEATTEATPFDKSKYIAWKNGSETIDQGANDNSEYGAEDTVKQDYFTLTGGTTNV